MLNKQMTHRTSGEVGRAYKLEPNSEINSYVKMATERAEWAWRDVMIGFKEVGYDVSQNEKDRIMQTLFKSKLVGLLKKDNLEHLLFAS